LTTTADTDGLAALAESLGRTTDDPRLNWRRMARPDQLQPPGNWRVWYVQGGRGGGKTRSGAQALAEWIQEDTDGDGEYGIIAPTYADAWTKCVEGESGLLRALGTSMKEVKSHTSRTVKNAWRTYGQVILHSGIVVYIDSASEGGLRIQGRNLKGAWCDEIGLWLNWEVAWNESLKYAVRMGRSQIVCTATPKASRPARKLIRSLIRNEPEHGGVVVTKLRTIDNIRNLSEAFARTVIGAAKGTRLERQELEGELLDDVANALWTRDLIDSIQCPGVGEPGGPEFLLRTFIGVDPSDGGEDSDEQAYTIMGQGPPDDHHLYVAENWGGQEAPAPFAKRVILKAVEWNAAIVVEKNHGGAWLTTVFEQVLKELVAQGTVPRDKRPRVEVIWASQAKRTRAEPVAAMYERNGGQMVKHCNRKVKDRDGETRILSMVDLEDQMATFTGAQGERSPDRLDSLVWAGTKFLPVVFGQPQGTPAHKWAVAKELEDIGTGPEQRMLRRRLRGAHGGAYREQRGWELDDFAPSDADAAEMLPGRLQDAVHDWH
jgi:phage terminase large subunit-like protein